MNKTIYIQEDMVPIWDRAKSICAVNHLNISNVIMGMLKNYVELHEPPVCECGRTLEADWKHCPGCGRPRRRRRSAPAANSDIYTDKQDGPYPAKEEDQRGRQQ